MGKFPQLFCLQRRHVGQTNFGTFGFANSIQGFTAQRLLTARWPDPEEALQRQGYAAEDHSDITPFRPHPEEPERERRHAAGPQDPHEQHTKDPEYEEEPGTTPAQA